MNTMQRKRKREREGEMRGKEAVTLIREGGFAAE